MSTYYLSTTGNDTTGDGSIGNPYATASKAIEVASNGDTIKYLDGTYTITSSTDITKQLTITSNSSTAANVVLNSSMTIFNIKESNVTISYLTLATTANDPLVTVDISSTGLVVPTFHTSNVINNCIIKFIKNALVVNGEMTITNNTFTRNDAGSQVADIIKVYSFRSLTISSNTLTSDAYETRYFIWFTHDTTLGGEYYDWCNSKGGTLTINGNTTNSTNETQLLTFLAIDYFNQYDYGSTLALLNGNENYNANTLVRGTITNNTTPNTINSRFIDVLVKSTNDFKMFDYMNINTNTIFSEYGVVHLDKDTSTTSAITVSTTDQARSIFKVYSNTIDTFVPPSAPSFPRTPIVPPVPQAGTDLLLHIDTSAADTVYTKEHTLAQNGDQAWWLLDISGNQNDAYHGILTKTPTAQALITNTVLFRSSTPGAVTRAAVEATVAADKKQSGSQSFALLNNQPFGPAATGHTVVYVYRPSDVSAWTGYGYLSGMLNTGSGGAQIWDGDGRGRETVGFGINTNTGPALNAADLAGQTFVYTVVADPTAGSTKIYYNQSLRFTGTYNSGYASATFQWSMGDLGTAEMDGYVCELQVRARPLGDAERTTLVDEMMTKWGIPFPPLPSWVDPYNGQTAVMLRFESGPPFVDEADNQRIIEEGFGPGTAALDTTVYKAGLSSLRLSSKSVKFPVPSLNADFTIDFWYRIDTADPFAPTYQTMVLFQYGTYLDGILMRSADASYMNGNQQWRWGLHGAPYTWTAFRMSRSGSVVRFYLDGQMISETAGVVGAFPANPANRYCSLGQGWENQYGAELIGNIDQFRVIDGTALDGYVPM